MQGVINGPLALRKIIGTIGETWVAGGDGLMLIFWFEGCVLLLEENVIVCKKYALRYWGKLDISLPTYSQTV